LMRAFPEGRDVHFRIGAPHSRKGGRDPLREPAARGFPEFRRDRFREKRADGFGKGDGFPGSPRFIPFETDDGFPDCAD